MKARTARSKSRSDAKDEIMAITACDPAFPRRRGESAGWGATCHPWKGGILGARGVNQIDEVTFLRSLQDFLEEGNFVATPILYGLPSEEGFLAVSRGQVRLGGYIIIEDTYGERGRDAVCKKCGKSGRASQKGAARIESMGVIGLDGPTTRGVTRVSPVFSNLARH
jgi:hypothetical protein